MRRNYILATAIFILFGLAACKRTQTNDTHEDLDRVEILLSKMTLEEKIGQMNLYSGFWDATGPVPVGGSAKDKYEDLKAGKVGALLNVAGVEKIRKLQETVVNESRLGIPLLFALDVIHGHKTLSPIPLAEAASWDLEAIEKSARIAAIEASARGINWTFAPMVDISRDARWGRVMEGGGEDPYLGSLIGAARVRGFQGDNLQDHNTIAACAKHLAAYGFVESGREYNAANISTNILYNVVLPPFQACVNEGVATVMNSFNTLNGIPATGDQWLQRDILKNHWDFKGFVVSDWASCSEMVTHGFARDLEHATELAVSAGSDMDMESYAYVTYLKSCVESGKVNEKNVDEAALRILRIKESLGLLDDPYKYCDSKREDTLLYHKDHLKAALEMAKKSIVLLKNKDEFLPLKKSEEVAVIGALAEDKTSPLGSWRLRSDDGTAISVLEGLDNLNIDYSYESGPELFEGLIHFVHEIQVNEDDRSGFDEAVQLAAKSDKVVLVLGEHGFQSGESRSRTKLNFPGFQEELMKAIYSVNKNIVLVVMSGRPLVLSWADENIPAVLQAWQLGTQSGNAISSVLYGDYNPSGKLPMCFPRSEGQVPIHYSRTNTGRPSGAGDVFWSHYIDESNDPLYTFGHGLSYTEFEYGNLNITVSQDPLVDLEFTVSNKGEYNGVETAQVYIRDYVASVVRPIKELKGFKKIALQAGETQTISISLDKSALGFYNNDGKFVFEQGDFEIMVGGSSNTILSKRITI